MPVKVKERKELEVVGGAHSREKQMPVPFPQRIAGSQGFLAPPLSSAGTAMSARLHSGSPFFPLLLPHSTLPQPSL
jgi:hypothetical protein